MVHTCKLYTDVSKVKSIECSHCKEKIIKARGKRTTPKSQKSTPTTKKRRRSSRSKKSKKSNEKNIKRVKAPFEPALCDRCRPKAVPADRSGWAYINEPECDTINFVRRTGLTLSDIKGAMEIITFLRSVENKEEIIEQSIEIIKQAGGTIKVNGMIELFVALKMNPNESYINESYINESDTNDSDTNVSDTNDSDSDCESNDYDVKMKYVGHLPV